MDKTTATPMPYKTSKPEHATTVVQGQQQLAAPEAGDAPELTDIDEPHRRVDHHRAQRGQGEGGEHRPQEEAWSAATVPSATSEYSWLRLPSAVPDHRAAAAAADRKAVEQAGRDVRRAEGQELLAAVDGLADVWPRRPARSPRCRSSRRSRRPARPGQVARSSPLRSGSAGVGSPRGISPIDGHALLARGQNSRRGAAASSMAISGPGLRGNKRWRPKSSASTPAARIMVGTEASASWVTKDRTWRPPSHPRPGCRSPCRAG